MSIRCLYVAVERVEEGSDVRIGLIVAWGVCGDERGGCGHGEIARFGRRRV